MIRRSHVLAAAILFLALAAPACSGGGGGGGDDDDDDDAATSATPTPAPPPSFCYVVWGSTAGGLTTEYYVDFPAAAWTSGGGPVVIDDVDNWAELSQRDSAGNLVFLLVATAGTITNVQASAGLEEGGAVALTDADAPRRHTDYLRGVTGTAGGGSFTGVWSDPSSPIFSTAGKTPGTGTIAITAVSGTADVPALVGDAYSYAQCYALGR